MAVDTTFAKQSFSNLPPWARGAIVIGGLTLAGYIIYKIVKAPAKIKESKDSKEEQANWQSEQEKLNKDPKKKQTVSSAQLKAYANKIFAAMDGYGTDEYAVVAPFYGLKTDGDFAGLQTAFGIREISSGAWNPEPNFKGNLIQAITNEVSSYWRAKINDILIKKGISYRV